MSTENSTEDAHTPHNPPAFKPIFDDIVKMFKQCNDIEFKEYVNAVSEDVSSAEDQVDALKLILDEFYRIRGDSSDAFDDETKRCMENTRCYFDSLGHADKGTPNGPQDTTTNASTTPAASPVAAAASPTSGAQPSDLERKVLAMEEFMRMQNENGQEKQGAQVRAGAGGPITFDVFGSLLTSFSSLFRAKKQAVGAAAEYLTKQAEIEFGAADGAVPSSFGRKAVFGEGTDGKDFSRHTATLEAVELAGRRLEEGRSVNMDAVRRHLDYLGAGVASAKDSDNVSFEDAERLKRTQSTLDEFAERAAKKTPDDPNEKQRLEEIIKMAQDIGRMLSEFFTKMVDRLKGLVGMNASNEDERATASTARPKI